VVLNTNNIIQ